MISEASTPWGRVSINWPDNMTPIQRAEVLEDFAKMDRAIAEGRYTEHRPPVTGKKKTPMEPE